MRRAPTVRGRQVSCAPWLSALPTRRFSLYWTKRIPPKILGYPEVSMAEARMETVLVVDDEKRVAQSIQRTLTRQGYSVPEYVTRAADFDGALARVNPDLVLLDIDLSLGASGIELATRLPKRTALL